jgi:hypothetical protein
MSYTTKEIQDLIEASGFEATLVDNIDLDQIEDEDVRESCIMIAEGITQLYRLFGDTEEYPDFSDDEDLDYED